VKDARSAQAEFSSDLDSAFAAALQRWADQAVLAGAQVTSVRPMPGNAGLSFGFEVNAGGSVTAFVIRLAPPGLRKRGNTDVLRQVPLLKVLGEAGIPVARVVSWTDDPGLFGTDAIIQEWVDGLPLHMSDASLSVRSADNEALVGRAVDVLAAIHQLDWQAMLPGWESPRAVAEEVDFWLLLVERTNDTTTVAAARRLAVQLKDTQPPDPPIGLLHGDYHTNNILFTPSGEIAAIVDWELAGVGAQLLDLGWLSLLTDPTAWAPEYRSRMRVQISPERLLARYQNRSGTDAEHFDWYRALACYRFAVITAFNLRLHRTGRRPDPWYETLASSIPVLLGRGSELISA
jgi:aminoglycoside phosphotransferase (APT) family kinase protein